MEAIPVLSTAPPETSKSFAYAPLSSFSSSSGLASTTPHAEEGSSRRNGVSAEGCALGYEGPLCAVCSDSYYFSATSTSCKSCDGEGRGQLAALILIPLLMIITLVSLIFSTFLMKPSSAAPSNDDAAQVRPVADGFDSDRKRKSGEIIREWLGKVETFLTPKLKIMTTVFQIISNLPLVINIQFTALSTRLFHAFR